MSEVSFNTGEIKKKIEETKLIIKNLREESKTNVEIEAHFFNNDEDFYRRYPYLIKMLIKNDNPEMLNKMIENMQLIEDGKQTMASTVLKLGNELAVEYNLPKIN